VSSGTHHRKEEPNEWTPVAPNPDQAAKKVFEEPSEDADDVGVSYDLFLCSLRLEEI